jgi:DNA polymerase III alpha subunit
MFASEILDADVYDVTAEMNCFKSDNDQFFKRVQVVGIIIDKKVFENRKEKDPYAFIEIDDGTSKIRVNAFDQPLIDQVKETELEDFVIVKGMSYSRTYKGVENKYIVPDIIKKSSKEEMIYIQMVMVGIRLANHYEIDYIPPAIDLKLDEYGILVNQTAEEATVSAKQEKDKPKVETKKDQKDEITNIIIKKIKSSKKGIGYGDLIDYITEKDIPQNDFEKVLTELVNDGKIKEDKDGSYQIVEE